MNTKGKRAYITGVFGQDGSYLSEYLLSLGYEVLGLESGKPREAGYIHALTTHPQFRYVTGDLGKREDYELVLNEFNPDEIYNFAAVSDLTAAANDPERTMRINFHAVDELVSTACSHNPAVRIFHALSSRILVPGEDGVIHESSPLTDGTNPYDVAKRKSYEEVVLKRRREGRFISSGFLCNHESPRRGSRFVTGKIVETLARIAHGEVAVLEVGNLESKRDWSFAGDFVRGMQASLQGDHSDDYVFGSGELHTVREFIEHTAQEFDMSLTWKGVGTDEEGWVGEQLIVRVNEAFYRPHDVSPVANITKLRALGYAPQVSFEELVRLMARDAYENVTPSSAS